MAGALHRETRAAQAHAAGPRRRILIAEDHEDTRILLRIFLEGRGFEVAEARNGEEAVRLCESEAVDLVLLDGGLPRLDGLDVTRRLRAGAPARNLPIVFLSGHAEPGARRAAFAAGCDEYLTKPFELDRLGSVLAHYLADEKGERV